MPATGTRDRAAIVGVGNSDFGALYRDRNSMRNGYDLAVDALRAAIEDSGLEKGDIDGLICCRLPFYGHFADKVGLRQPRYVNILEGSGRMSGVAVQLAVMVIASGQAETIALVYGNNGRSAGASYGGEASNDPNAYYDEIYGMTSPGAYVAMMYRRYQHLYGVPDGALARSSHQQPRQRRAESCGRDEEAADPRRIRSSAIHCRAAALVRLLSH